MARLLHTTAGKLSPAHIGQRVAFTFDATTVVGWLSDFELDAATYRGTRLVRGVRVFLGGRIWILPTATEITLGDLDLPGGAP